MTQPNLEDIINSIFKAYDVRGKVGSELSPSLVEKIGKAVAVWLPTNGPVAVGRDMRPDSEELANAVIKGLTEQGREVWNIGQVTSDMIYFAAGNFNLAGGIMITASHNPGDYNGIKFCGQGAKPIGIESGLAEIRDLVMKDEWIPSHVIGEIQDKEVTEDWITHALSFVDTENFKPLKVVIDAGNGMAGKIIPELEPYVPFDITEMYFELDGTFPNHVANPIEPENIKDLIDRVKSEKADIGIAFDGDGDRAVLIDENGVALSGTEMTAMLAQYFLKNHPGSTILYNATCGWIVPETIQANDGQGIRTKVGHSFIKAEMREHNAIFAGESSGHYYFRDNFMADSGLIAALVGLQVLCQSGKKLSEIASEFKKYSHIPETNFEVNDKEQILQSLKLEFSEHKQDTLDGLTIWLKDQVSAETSDEKSEGSDIAWVNIRPSNTEPILRLNAEARNQDILENIVAKVTKIIESN